MRLRRRQGFSLIEALLILIVMSIAFLGFGYLYGNVTQEALKADLTVLATKLGREKMEGIIQTKADSGYGAVSSESSTSVSSGTWSFDREVVVTYVNPADFSTAGSDTGYKKVEVTVSWGAGVGDTVTITSLVTDMVPSAVTGGGGGFPPCP